MTKPAAGVDSSPLPVKLWKQSRCQGGRFGLVGRILRVPMASNGGRLRRSQGPYRVLGVSEPVCLSRSTSLWATIHSEGATCEQWRIPAVSGNPFHDPRREFKRQIPACPASHQGNFSRALADACRGCRFGNHHQDVHAEDERCQFGTDRFRSPSNILAKGA